MSLDLKGTLLVIKTWIKSLIKASLVLKCAWKTGEVSSSSCLDGEDTLSQEKSIWVVLIYALQLILALH